MSCCAVVLVDQPTKDVAATELAYLRRTPCRTALRPQRRCEGQAAVRAVQVVMLDIGPQDTDKLLAADVQQLVQALPADRATQRSAIELALGACTGVGMISAPVERTGHPTPW